MKRRKKKGVAKRQGVVERAEGGSGGRGEGVGCRQSKEEV